MKAFAINATHGEVLLTYLTDKNVCDWQTFWPAAGQTLDVGTEYGTVKSTALSVTNNRYRE